MVCSDRGYCICDEDWTNADEDGTNGCEQYVFGNVKEDTCPDNSDKCWHGETAVASWTATGDNKPAGVSPFHPRDYSSMFDDDLTTYWVGDYSDADGSVSVQNTVVVTFNEEVQFHNLQIVTRPDYPEWFAGTYQTLCVTLDGGSSGQVCTASNLVVGVSEVIVLAPASPVTVTQVELAFNTGEVAQAADVKIQYKGRVICSKLENEILKEAKNVEK